MTRSNVNKFVKNAKQLAMLPTSKRLNKWVLFEYPFDAQLLNLSPLYLKSRQLYTELGGTFNPRICSTMRGLSAQDLFADTIDYTPSLTQITWFAENLNDVVDPEKELESLERYNEISVFHEQNHRVIWRLLPPAPKGQRELGRYLNFAESLVVVLDIALGNQLGPKHSPIFEQMKIIYRSAGRTSKSKSKRDYFLAVFVATYLLLELINPEDIQAAVNYILPGQKTLNHTAVHDSLELSELFTRITNPEWQARFWKQAQKKLAKKHAGNSIQELSLPQDPLDLSDDLARVHHILDFFEV
ncbi:MAG: hypothetical protein JNL11_11245 [Bdellovibrionaceae bacterium]|nr:hypothetical protein [Pseudobdellovibrionaceae bacterium]